MRRYFYKMVRQEEAKQLFHGERKISDNVIEGYARRQKRAL